MVAVGRAFLPLVGWGVPKNAAREGGLAYVVSERGRRKWLIDDKNLSWPFYPENEVMERREAEREGTLRLCQIVGP